MNLPARPGDVNHSEGVRGDNQGMEPLLVLTNDDGLDEPGLAALAAAARALGRTRIIAPLRSYSNCGHAVTTQGALRIQPRGAERWGVAGTPADCVRLALHHLAREAAWVLAGINAGGNLGTDLVHSGTAAAAREAALRGVPAIALSHYHARGRAFDWPRATGWALRVLQVLLDRPTPEGTFWNVNFPHLLADDPEPDIVFCPVDPSPLPLSFRIEQDDASYNGNYHARRRRPGTDVDVCFRGQIAVSQVPAFLPLSEATLNLGNPPPGSS